jgi:predicted dehydrogenase
VTDTFPGADDATLTGSGDPWEDRPLERSGDETITAGSHGPRARLRAGVVGCGLVAQVMHLPYLRELHEEFQVVTLCDLSREVVDAAGIHFPDARRTTDPDTTFDDGLDVVFALTPGSHAPIAIAAAEAGVHIFVEKPMCFSVAEGREMIAAADSGGVRLMVGYMKRFDPAYEELSQTLDRTDVRFARVTTLESPLEPYVQHYPLVRGRTDPELAARLIEDDESRVTAAIATDDPVLRRLYRVVLLDSMVHELNALRGLLGEPDELRFADVWGEPHGVTLTMRFGETEAVCSWVDLPGFAGYEQELAFYAPDSRTSLVFPSPFLRSMPTRLVLEGGEAGTPAAFRTERIVAFDEAFKRELREFHSCVVDDCQPRTPGTDAIRDIALSQAVVSSLLSGGPLARPTEIAE